MPIVLDPIVSLFKYDVCHLCRNGSIGATRRQGKAVSPLRSGAAHENGEASATPTVARDVLAAPETIEPSTPRTGAVLTPRRTIARSHSARILACAASLLLACAPAV